MGGFNVAELQEYVIPRHKARQATINPKNLSNESRTVIHPPRKNELISTGLEYQNKNV